MEEKRILFTGGGTAGHVIVNLALIPYFQKKGWAIDYIGSKDGIERSLIESLDGITYYSIATGKLRRYMSIENLIDPFKVMFGTMQAWNIIRKIKPSIVFSKGGFVSVPVVIAAKLNNIPTIIHESDYTPGLANKLAVRFAKKVLTTFPDTVNNFPVDKAKYIGAVIRKELFQGDKGIGYSLTKFDESKPILMIIGGSSGSQKINELVRENLSTLLDIYQIIHICGRGNIDSTINEDGYIQFEYVGEELKHLLSITNFVVSRAGANAIFEFLALRIPMLLIPLSRAASRGDQIVNAHFFKQNGYAHVLEEEDLEQETFLYKLKQLKNSEEEILKQMETYECSHSYDKVIELILKMSK